MRPHYPPNPDYGSGVFRRAVRLTNDRNFVFGELEDTMHAIRCQMTHDGARILSIQPDFVRMPMDTCSGAYLPLQALVGLNLATSPSWFYGDDRPRSQCTHLYDLVWWMLTHVNRTASVRHYEAVIPDRPADGPGSAILSRDGKEVLSWRVADDVILEPMPFAGRHILKSFAAWAATQFEQDDLEAIFVLQKAYFVSRARKVRTSALVGPLRKEDAVMKGACWSYSSPQFERAHRVDSARDLSDGADLLKFR